MDWLIMDWLILVLVTPLIIVAVVLLYGFVGCGSFGSEEPEPAPPPPPPTKPQKPANLRAKAAGTNLVNLNWDPDPTWGSAVKFTVERVEEGQTAGPTFAVPSGTTFPDQVDLKEGTTYEYTVRATLAGIDSDPSDVSKATTFPEAPFDVVAIPEDVNRIDISWKNKSTSTKVLKVIIQDDSGAATAETEVAKGIQQPLQLPVLEGSAHKFRVIAFRDGFQEGVAQEVRSLPLTPVPAKPLAFKFDLTKPAGTNQAVGGYTLVQKIGKALLKNNGTVVSITVRGPIGIVGNLTIARVSISKPDTSPGKDEYDSLASDLVQVAGVVVQPGASITIPITYTIPPIPEDLLIAFDITQGSVRRFSPLPGAVVYTKAAIQQAWVADRTTGAPPVGYTKAAGFLYLIEKIEVS